MALDASTLRPMSKAPKRPRDPNQLAKLVVDIATGEHVDVAESTQSGEAKALAALGRIGGLKGGRARAEKLTADQRREIAQRAAAARWKNDS